jgi:hypothetical protein
MFELVTTIHEEAPVEDVNNAQDSDFPLIDVRDEGETYIWISLNSFVAVSPRFVQQLVDSMLESEVSTAVGLSDEDAENLEFPMTKWLERKCSGNEITSAEVVKIIREE